jgi:hypothetical protein
VALVSNYSGENYNLNTDIEYQHKATAKQRKKASKKTKGLDKDLKEGLGANEEEGIANAESVRDNQLEMARDAKKNMLQMHEGSAINSGGGMSAISKDLKSGAGASTLSKKDALKELADAKDLQKRLEEDERIRS